MDAPAPAGYRLDPERLRALIASLQDMVARLSRSAMELDAAAGAPPPGQDEVSLNMYRQLVGMTEQARASISDRQARLLAVIAALQEQLRAYEQAEESGAVPV
ncbi:PE domain-containing protein [Pseudonocardia sp. KRD291]|uniref:PE domain-containing protein n=1 Tax=Pseudonocardia sp. KRD291 TaxID=2792007 RepID=UPI001C4A2790|nr:PE domain-containing protein [Pseudonocardia sp. KRD291]MBW0106900.1 PE domain-containing protein [Pseudonocardia sp. KRD291]